MFNNFTNVEKAYIGSVEHIFPTNIPYITVENFPKLGKLTAFRFLEWAAEHPDGVISRRSHQPSYRQDSRVLHRMGQEGPDRVGHKGRRCLQGRERTPY